MASSYMALICCCNVRGEAQKLEDESVSEWPVSDGGSTSIESGVPIELRDGNAEEVVEG